MWGANQRKAAPPPLLLDDSQRSVAPEDPPTQGTFQLEDPSETGLQHLRNRL